MPNNKGKKNTQSNNSKLFNDKRKCIINDQNKEYNKLVHTQLDEFAFIKKLFKKQVYEINEFKKECDMSYKKIREQFYKERKIIYNFRMQLIKKLCGTQKTKKDASDMLFRINSKQKYKLSDLPIDIILYIAREFLLDPNTLYLESDPADSYVKFMEVLNLHPYDVVIDPQLGKYYSNHKCKEIFDVQSKVILKQKQSVLYLKYETSSNSYHYVLNCITYNKQHMAMLLFMYLYLNKKVFIEQRKLIDIYEEKREEEFEKYCINAISQEYEQLRRKWYVSRETYDDPYVEYDSNEVIFNNLLNDCKNTNRETFYKNYDIINYRNAIDPTKICTYIAYCFPSQYCSYKYNPFTRTEQNIFNTVVNTNDILMFINNSNIIEHLKLVAKLCDIDEKHYITVSYLHKISLCNVEIIRELLQKPYNDITYYLRNQYFAESN